MSHWTSIKVSGKLTEVKDVVNPKTKSHLIDDQAELHACLRIDNNPDMQYQTTPLSSAFPMWAEDFEFHLKHGFREIEVVVWGNIHSLSATDVFRSVVPIGKVYITRQSVKSNEETWYSLRDASLESKVSGRIHLKIEHFPPNLQRKIHGFSVTVIRATDLYMQKSASVNPFVVLHMVPDLDALTAEATTVKSSTNNPLYSEAFFFSCDENQDPTKKILFCSVWDKSNQGDINFLGLCEIPLAQVISKGAINRWYYLSALADDSIYSRPVKNKYLSDDSSPARDLIKELQKIDQSVRVRKAHTFKEKNVAMARCLHCSQKMMGMHLACLQCSLYCHHKCREDAGFSCGGNGSIRLALTIEKTTVLSLDDYYDLIHILQSNRYEMILAIGKQVSEKQELSKYCQSIFGNQFFDFLVLVIQNEIRNSDNTKTLFRGNTLASKAIYIFMTQIGMDYLHSTLGQTLQTIINSRAACEIDMNKLDDPAAVTKNLESLINYLDLVLRAIFNSLPQMPASLRELFKVIQTEASKKFPEEKNVRYTSVTGFLFLRFLVPTILNPKQFGINADSSSQATKRKLMLIGKTLQNLANLVNFEKKEDSMLALNSFLEERSLGLKTFLDQLLEPLISGKAILTSTFDPLEIALDVARLYKILSTSKHLLSNIKDYESLDKCLSIIEAKVNAIEKSLIMDPLDDTGVDLEGSVIGSVDSPQGANFVSEKVEMLRSMNMATPNLTTLLMGGTITIPNARKRSLRISEDDLRKLVREKQSQVNVSESLKLKFITEASTNSFQNLVLGIPAQSMDNSRSSIESRENLYSSYSPTATRNPSGFYSTANAKKQVNKMDTEKDKHIQKLMQETSNLRIAIREQEAQFKKELALLKEEQAQELHKWKTESSFLIRNEILEHYKAVKFSEEVKTKRESGMSTISKAESDKQRAFNHQITEDLLKLQKVVEEKAEILTELGETLQNQNDNFDQLHSDMCNFDGKIRSIDEDLSKRIENIVDVKISKRRSRQSSQSLLSAANMDAAIQKAIHDKFQDIEKSASLVLDYKIQEISTRYNSEIAKFQHIDAKDFSQFRKDINRIEDVAHQALDQIKTLSRRYYYASKMENEERSTREINNLSLYSLAAPDKGASEPANQQNYNDYAKSPGGEAGCARRMEYRASIKSPEEYLPKPVEFHSADLAKTPNPPAGGFPTQRTHRISAIIQSGHVRDRLKSFEESFSEENLGSRRTYLTTQKS